MSGITSGGAFVPIDAPQHASHAFVVTVEGQNLTGATFEAVVLDRDSGATAMTLTVTPVDLAIGRVAISWTRAQVMAVAQGTYTYTFGYQLASFHRQVLHGTFKIRR